MSKDEKLTGKDLQPWHSMVETFPHLTGRFFVGGEKAEAFRVGLISGKVKGLFVQTIEIEPGAFMVLFDDE